MPKMTFTIRTASQDDLLAAQGVPSYFAGVLHCLRQQTFQDFEFVYVDMNYEEHKDAFAAYKTDFVVKHVPPHPEHRYWSDLGWAAMAAATNTAILYADGELIVSLDDAEFFNADLLERYWKHYQAGACMHACHRRLRSLKTENGLPVVPLDGDLYINDSRSKYAQTVPVLVHNNGQWLYAGKSFTLEDALLVNGFNERLDGNCTLEDCEFGMRVQRLGRRFTLDRDGCVFIVEHPTYLDAPSYKKKLSRNFVAIENHGFACIVRELGDTVANKFPLDQTRMDIINRETKKFRGFDIYAEENRERLAVFRAVPTFDLCQQREELRKTSAWIW